jgi:prevent-host-death family protein
MFRGAIDNGHLDGYHPAMASYSVAEAKNNLSKLLDLMLAGEDVTITRRGEPIASLVPTAPIGRAVDVEWVTRHQVIPASGTDFDSAEMIRQMRDEYRY